MKLLVITSFLILSFDQAWGQVDPSAAILLNSGRQNQNALDSSRYTVKPSTKRQESNSQQVFSPSNESYSNTSGTNTDIKVPVTLLPEKVKKDESKYQLTDQEAVSVKDFILGGDGQKIVEYKNVLHPQDTRRNLIELNISPVYFYNDSSSNYWMRAYNLSGGGLEFQAKIWMTPFFGFHSSYFSSLNAEMHANPFGTELFEADISLLELGFRFRNYFGYSRKSGSVSFGLDFSEYKLDVPSTADYRVGLKSTGARLSLEANLPMKTTKSWFLGAEIMPDVSHSEVTTPNTAASGTGNSTDAIGLWFGRRYILDRKNQIFWKVSHKVEKSIFEGQATEVDPVSTQQPRGVSVTNSTSLFQIGFTWGH